MSERVTLPGTLPGLLGTYAPVVTITGLMGVVLYKVGNVWFTPLENHGITWVQCENLSLNLSTPEGMCRAARWLAERLGMDPGVTAPTWEKRGELWLLVAKDKLTGKPTSVARWGLPTDDPAAALRLACLAVAGSQ